MLLNVCSLEEYLEKVDVVCRVAGMESSFSKHISLIKELDKKYGLTQLAISENGKYVGAVASNNELFILTTFDSVFKVDVVDFMSKLSEGAI